MLQYNITNYPKKKLPFVPCELRITLLTCLRNGNTNIVEEFSLVPIEFCLCSHSLLSFVLIIEQFWSLKFQVIFILVLSILKFLFWQLIYIFYFHIDHTKKKAYGLVVWILNASKFKQSCTFLVFICLVQIYMS